jgi:hypothetical protein
MVFLTLFFFGALLSPSAEAVETHEILLGPHDRYEIAETSQWRFEVVRESSERFADVKIKPKQGDDCSLTLYFLADTPDLGRLDTPQKIATSVTAGAERYLPLTVEKKISLQTVSPRGSYGSLTVLTAAGLQGAPGEFRYQTRGMVRLSPDAALGFSLLSNEINTAGYRQLLNYIYSFIKLAPNVAAKPATASVAKSTAVPAAMSAPSTSPLPKPAQRGPRQDMRDCLNLPTDAEIMRCVGGAK